MARDSKMVQAMPILKRALAMLRQAQLLEQQPGDTKQASKDAKKVAAEIAAEAASVLGHKAPAKKAPAKKKAAPKKAAK